MCVSLLPTTGKKKNMNAVSEIPKKNEQDCVSEPLDTVTERTVEPSQNDPQPAEKPQEVLQCELWASDLQRLYNDEAEYLRLAADLKKKPKRRKKGAISCFSVVHIIIRRTKRRLSHGVKTRSKIKTNLGKPF